MRENRWQTGLNVHSNGGRVEHSEKDTAIHILGLEPYTKYFIEIDEKGFDNISWRIDNKSLAVIIDPNMLKLVEMPVSVMGEVTGTIMLEEKGSSSGLGRIIVNIDNEQASGNSKGTDGRRWLFQLLWTCARLILCQD